jgi:DNA-binding MarR family transcriptional regulator
MPPPHQIDPESITFLILDIARLSRAGFERRVAAASLGVTPAEARVLGTLARCGKARQNALADTLGVAKMSMTGVLDRLEAAGLVSRSEDPADRRAKIVRLTPAAAPIIAALAALAEDLRQSLRGTMPEAEWRAFLAAAKVVRDNLLAARPAAPAAAAAERRP